MTTLQEIVDGQVEAGRVPGAVALVADVGSGAVDVAVSGRRAIDGAPMTRDTVFRIASLTKPILAAATMALVDRGRFGLDDPVATWLPELAEPMVLRSIDAELDDVVPAVRPITVRHLLTFQGGHGFPSDFSVPWVQHVFAERLQGPPRPQEARPADEWVAAMGRLPLLHQPGEGWTYNAGSDLLGVLLARAEGAPLSDVFGDTVLGPLAMADTAFVADEESVTRMATQYRRDDTGALELLDPPEGQWASPPPFLSGAGGLVSTVDDWLAFARMLLASGTGPDGARVLDAESVRLMMTSHAEAEADSPFLQGHGWGFGGSVDRAATEPWNVPGRYGWTGGSGTAGYVIPSRGLVTIWMGQVEMAGPDDFSALAAFLSWAAGR
ncbi:MAG TPA: serine hydrolase domain-containing protein [Iamia sp.]|jgi:CubicO group peptidase (beta-lactamase class C family)|nr:serine hydrolase domain-containing protein [Iamia sp.]